MTHLRNTLAILITAVAFLAGVCWVFSYCWPGVLEHPYGGEVYHLVNRRGTMRWVSFSAEAEAGGYWEMDIRYWQVEMAAIPLAVLAWWWRLRRRKGGAFPVEVQSRADRAN